MTLCELNFIKKPLEVQCEVLVYVQIKVLQVGTIENFLILHFCVKMLTTVSNE